jgi:hypothetical protein
MDFDVSDFFPNASMGLKNIGFFFGAGTSRKAGYPLMPSLTKDVLQKINSDDLEILGDLVTRSLAIQIDVANGTPNIEEISDVLESALLIIDRNDPKYLKFNDIRNQIREKIFESLQITTPDFSDHVRFFNALSRIFSGKSETIWIFTLNYDLLFEIAASKVKVPLFNGFVGTSLRFFNNQSFHYSIGTIEGIQFHNYRNPIFKIMKLHGSLDWWKCDNSVFSTENRNYLSTSSQRVMVLPRKKKMSETLDSPYNDIFRYSDRILGSQCKYLVSCGYSYGDEHINDTLLLPKVQQNKIKLTALVKDEPQNFKKFNLHNSFSYGTETSIKKNNRVEESGTELWQFEKFVDLLHEYAGLE